MGGVESKVFIYIWTHISINVFSVIFTFIISVLLSHTIALFVQSCNKGDASVSPNDARIGGIVG